MDDIKNKLIDKIEKYKHFGTTVTPDEIKDVFKNYNFNYEDDKEYLKRIVLSVLNSMI